VSPSLYGGTGNPAYVNEGGPVEAKEAQALSMDDLSVEDHDQTRTQEVAN